MNRLNPLTGLVFATCLILIVFIFPLKYFALSVFLFVVLPFSLMTKSLKAVIGVVVRFVLPFSIFLFFVHCFLVPGESYVTVYGIEISQSGFNNAFLISARVCVMVGSITVLFKTTDPVRITRELAARGVPVFPLYVINTTLQILPRMKKRAETIREAQRSRGLEIEGNIARRLKALIPLIGPLFFGLFKEVEQRALILEIRGFKDSDKTCYSFNTSDDRWQKFFRKACILTVIAALALRIWIQFA